MKHDHDPSYVLAAGIVMPVLGIIFVTLRFYTRSKQKAGYGADDWLSLFALVSVYAFIPRHLISECSNLQFMVLGSGICLIVGKLSPLLGAWIVFLLLCRRQAQSPWVSNTTGWIAG